MITLHSTILEVQLMTVNKQVSYNYYVGTDRSLMFLMTCGGTSHERTTTLRYINEVFGKI